MSFGAEVFNASGSRVASTSDANGFIPVIASSTFILGAAAKRLTVNVSVPQELTNFITRVIRGPYPLLAPVVVSNRRIWEGYDQHNLRQRIFPVVTSAVKTGSNLSVAMRFDNTTGEAQLFTILVIRT